MLNPTITTIIILNMLERKLENILEGYLNAWGA